MGGSARDIGLVLAARAIPLVLFLLIGGVWSDHIPRRTVMMASDVVRGVCQAVFAVILVMGVGGVLAIAAIMFVYGSAEAFFRPALSGVVPQAVSVDRLQEAYGLVAITSAVGMVLGGVLGGVAVAVISPAAAIAIDAASFAVGSALGQNFFNGNPSRSAPWRRRFIQNTPRPTPRDVPLLIAQSTADEVVLPRTTATVITRWCAAGVHIGTLWIDKVPHNDTAMVVGPSVVQWIEGRLSGAPAPNDCSMPPPVPPLAG